MPSRDPVILSVVDVSRSEASTESKDPIALILGKAASGNFYQVRKHRGNSLTCPSCRKHRRDPSTPWVASLREPTHSAQDDSFQCTSRPQSVFFLCCFPKCRRPLYSWLRRRRGWKVTVKRCLPVLPTRCLQRALRKLAVQITRRPVSRAMKPVRGLQNTAPMQCRTPHCDHGVDVYKRQLVISGQ